MSTINVTHITIVAESLEVIYRQSRMTGKLNSSDLYLLEAINKFLGGCETSLTTQQRRILFSLYNNIMTSSKNICNHPALTVKTISSTPKFIQNGSSLENVYDSVYSNTFS